MFRIGEFSKIAQVSGRLLRYYDEIGLLKPRHIDPWTGYRYYMADQLPRLNRILALKDLGLSLEQIQQLLDHHIGTNEIRALYLDHKTQLEQSLREELARLHQVQLRLNQLDSQDEGWMPDVVVKEIPAQCILSYRNTSISGDDFFQLFEKFCDFLSNGKIEKGSYGSLLTILYSEIFIPETEMDLEIGFLLPTKQGESLMLTKGIELTMKELPASPQMATIVHQGLDDHPITYNALGRWLEQNEYRIIGPGRELLLENYYPANPEKCILEIQFPIERFR